MRRASPTRAATREERLAVRRGRPGRASSGCDEREVLGLDGEGAPWRRARRLATRGGVALAGGDGGLGGLQRAAQGERALAVGAAQVGVAAGEREAVGLADGRADLDRDGHVEVAHEPADDERLLGVLLAEEGDVGPDHVQQLGDDGGDAVEVRGAAVRALERLGERRRRGPCVAKPGG